MAPPPKPRFFRSAEALRAWLGVHHADRDELVIGFYKAGTKKPGATYPEALDEALCFGWIDGVRSGIDGERYQVRFTPRKAKSIWSKVNLRHVARLEKEGRMRAEGRAALAARTAARTGVYSFEQERPSELDPARAAKLRANARAHAYFEAQSPSYRRTAAFWVMSPKRDATRDQRLAILVDCSARQGWAPPFCYGKNVSKKPKPLTE